MEDDDEITPEPDDKGVLVLSNRAWVHLDPAVWSYALKLIKLDISYNHITEIPPQIGEMVLLRELIASFNKIISIPAELGKLRRLRKISLNNNRIKVLPPELGSIEGLEELHLGENLVEELPVTLSKLTGLKILKMTNNRLRSIPFEIANLFTLEEFDCGNNPHLDTVPARWRGDTESLLFTCRLHRDYNLQMTELHQANSELSRHSQLIEEDNMHLKEKIMEMQGKIDTLNKNMPKKVAKKMAREEQKRLEQELMDADQNDKKKCVIM